jgi:HSP20 family protein
MTLTRWSPVRDLAAVEVDLLNRMLDTAFGGEALAQAAWMPPVDIYETADKDVIVKVDLPGVKRDEIKVTFENQVLSIEGQRQAGLEGAEGEQGRAHRLERSHGSFRRSFTLPATVDAARVDASYQDGVLVVKLPRREESRPRTIAIG